MGRRLRTLQLGMAFLCLAGCHLFPGMSGRDDGADTADKLSRIVQQSLTNPDRPPVPLAEVTSFEWDRVWFFGPYTKPSQIEARLGFSWPDAGKFQMDWRDDAILTVFSNGQRVVRAMAYPRKEGDLASLANHTVPRDRALLVVKRDKSGWIRLELGMTPEGTQIK